MPRGILIGVAILIALLAAKWVLTIRFVEDLATGIRNDDARRLAAEEREANVGPVVPWWPAGRCPSCGPGRWARWRCSGFPGTGPAGP